MKHALALAACFGILSGCFVFDNPNDLPPSAAFLITVDSESYSGTYVWDPDAGANGAFTSEIGGTSHYIYRHPSYRLWYLSTGADESQPSPIANSLSAGFPLPPTSGGWTPTNSISSVDVTSGGIWADGSTPNDPPALEATLRVHYAKGDAGDTADFQWQIAGDPAGPWTDAVNETGVTFYASPTWGPTYYVRVRVTPTTDAGALKGSAVESPPVGVGGA